MYRSLSGVALFLVIFAFVQTPVMAATSCEDLSKLSLPNTTITLTQTVAAGSFTPQGGARGGNQFSNLPAFCRIQATLKPSNDSDIKIELWMPAAAAWNGEYDWSANILKSRRIKAPATPKTTAALRANEFQNESFGKPWGGRDLRLLPTCFGGVNETG